MSKKPSDAAEIEQAKRNAAVAKARVQTTVGALKQRANPRTIASEAVDSVREKTGAIGERANDVARTRPVATGVVAGVAALIVFRKPIGKVARRLFSSKDRQERRERKAQKKADKLAIKVAKEEAKTAKHEAKAARRQAKADRRAARHGDSHDALPIGHMPADHLRPDANIRNNDAAMPSTGGSAANQE